MYIWYLALIGLLLEVKEIKLTKTFGKPEFELFVSFNIHLNAGTLTEDLEGFFFLLYKTSQSPFLCQSYLPECWLWPHI